MNPLAVELNEQIKAANPHVYEMLSEFGRELYFPKGILAQSAEAKQKAHKLNATLGIGTEKRKAMHLSCVADFFTEDDPDQLFPYAPATGRADLRAAWRDRQLEQNPRLGGKAGSLPIVTSALTHGLSLAGDLFVDRGDTVLTADKLWGNYRLIYNTRYGAQIETFRLYSPSGAFDRNAFAEAVVRHSDKGKLIVLLNFPNNPCGFTPTPDDANAMRDAIVGAADQGRNIVVVCDDAYFGLIYDEAALQESVAGYLAGEHPRVFVVKLDGATKEIFVWGFRVGFVTFFPGPSENADAMLAALEKKVAGGIRSALSNGPMPSQTAVLHALRSGALQAQRAEKVELMRARFQEAARVLADPKYADVWDVYPFNSGYFMCLRMKAVDAEPLRVHLLDKYGIGVIAAGERDVRVALSCVEVEEVAMLYDTIREAAKELAGA